VFRQCGDDNGSVVAPLNVAVRMVGVVRVQFDKAELRHALDQKARGQRARSVDAADIGGLAVFFMQPKFLEHFVELVIVAKLSASAG
jgi:hypothetical protein